MVECRRNQWSWFGLYCNPSLTPIHLKYNLHLNHDHKNKYFSIISNLDPRDTNNLTNCNHLMLGVNSYRDLVLVDHGGGVGHVLVLVLGDHGDDLVLRPPGGGAPVDVS